MTWPLRLAAVLVPLLLPGCANFEDKPEPRKPTVPPGQVGRYSMDSDAAPLPHQIPPEVLNTPDAVPRYEPPSRSGNSPSYSVFGQTYEVRKSAKNFTERGLASWYGRKFHGHKTASGERYDMFAMSAAHKTLPLPTYIRVRRVDNGKSVVVKVNDRGPFHGKRILDLSYAAAARLGMIGQGSAMVEIEAIHVDRNADVRIAVAPPPAPNPPITASMTAAPRRGWLQIGAYADPINALALREDLNQAGIGPVEVWSGGGSDTGTLHRVLAGPFASSAAAQVVRERVLTRGLSADWVDE